MKDSQEERDFFFLVFNSKLEEKWQFWDVRCGDDLFSFFSLQLEIGGKMAISRRAPKWWPFFLSLYSENFWMMLCEGWRNFPPYHKKGRSSKSLRTSGLAVTRDLWSTRPGFKSSRGQWSCCCALGKGTLQKFSLLGASTRSSKLHSYSICI